MDRFLIIEEDYDLNKNNCIKCATVDNLYIIWHKIVFRWVQYENMRIKEDENNFNIYKKLSSSFEVRAIQPA